MTLLGRGIIGSTDEPVETGPTVLEDWESGDLSGWQSTDLSPFSITDSPVRSGSFAMVVSDKAVMANPSIPAPQGETYEWGFYAGGNTTAGIALGVQEATPDRGDFNAVAFRCKT